MSTIEHSMLRLGRILAADQDLTVECRGMVPYASPGKIVIPSLENLDHLGPDAERMMHGLLNHECGHASDTDFELYEKAGKVNKGFKNLLNSLDDGYIEARQGLRYKGARWNLERKNTWYLERADRDGKTIADTFNDPKLDDWSKFTLGLTMCVRPYGGVDPEFFKKLHKDTHDRLMHCVDEIAEIKALATKAKATADVYKIAEKLYARFSKEMNPKGSTEIPNHLLILVAGFGGEDMNPEKAIEVELLIVLEGTDLGAGGDYDGRPIEEAEGQGHDNPKPRGTKPYIVFSHDYDHEVDVTGDVAVSEKFEELMHETSEASDAFILAFEAALRARREKAPVFGLDEGNIDPYALGEYAVGATQADTIFSQDIAEVDDDDVAVAILVDCSGSMGSYSYPTGKSRLAAQTATAIHRACAACSIEHEITGFTTSGWPGDTDYYGEDHEALIWQAPLEKMKLAQQHLLSAWQQGGQDPRLFARIFHGADPSLLTSARPPLCVPSYAVFKNFGASDARGISHITGISANLDGEAVIWQARRLAKRPERRRVMFVLSDGYPSAARSETDEHGYLKESVHRAIDAGIEVYGIGIQSHAVAEFYPIHWIANKLSDLPGIALGALTEILTRNRTERTWVSL